MKNIRYAVVNAMQSSSDCYGRIISRHRSVAAAVTSDSRLQRATKRANGRSSYLPTLIIEMPADYRGSWAYRHNTRCLTQDELIEYAY